MTWERVIDFAQQQMAYEQQKVAIHAEIEGQARGKEIDPGAGGHHETWNTPQPHHRRALPGDAGRG